MKLNQLTKGETRRVMYVENKDGLIEGSRARIGWVGFSKAGRTVYYKERALRAIGGSGVRGNFRDESTGEEFWISGIKKRGSNAHPLEAKITPVVDDDAREAYEQLLREA